MIGGTVHAQTDKVGKFPVLRFYTFINKIDSKFGTN